VLAEVHRCRQPSGALLMTDDPSKFPPDCEPVKNGEVEESATGSFSLMPSRDAIPEASAAVEQAVRAQQEQIEERRDQVEQWSTQAGSLAAEYEQAVARRNEAYGSWSYDSRTVVRESLEQMERVKKEKQQLLRELEQAYIPAPERQAIKQTLDRIPQ